MVFLTKSHEAGSKNNSSLLVNPWSDLDGRIIVFFLSCCCGAAVLGGGACCNVGPSSPEQKRGPAVDQDIQCEAGP